MSSSPAAVLNASVVVPVLLGSCVCGSNARLLNWVRTPASASRRLRTPLAAAKMLAGSGAKDDLEPGAVSGAENRRELGPAVSSATLI